MPDYPHPRHGRPAGQPANPGVFPAQPDALRRLSLSCPCHSRPLPMRPVGETVSACGEALVLYACVDAQCHYREGWRLDAAGQPHLAVSGIDQSRR